MILQSFWESPVRLLQSLAVLLIVAGMALVAINPVSDVVRYACFGVVAVAYYLLARNLYTTRKELEWKNAIVDKMFAGTAMTRLDTGEIIYVNPRFEQMFGYQEGELLGQPVSILNAGESEAAVQQSMEILESLKQNNHWTGELLNKRKDGSLFWTSSSISTFTMPRYGLVVVGVQEDIDARKQAQAQLEKLNIELEQRIEDRTKELQDTQEKLIQSEKMAVLGELAATISHELRNPLSVLTNTLYTLESGIQDMTESQERAFNRIRRTIRSCNTIIEDMLEYTRVVEPELEVAVFEPWLREVLEEVELPETVSMTVKLDTGDSRVAMKKDSLRRAIINLLHNASQAMETVEAPKLEIESFTKNGWLHLVISDNGQGIEEENIARIFDPLFSTRSFGVGLGLAIVQKIITKHKGRIELANRTDGQGARATIELPLVE